jgi:hypothetical protein
MACSVGRSDCPSSNLGEGAALSTTPRWGVRCFSMFLPQEPHKQRLRRWIQMAISTVGLRLPAASHCSHQSRHHEFKGKKIQDLTAVAERVGFEPTVEFPLHTLSKRAP